MDRLWYRAWSCKGLALQLWYFSGLPNVHLSKSFNQSVRLEGFSNRFKMNHKNWEVWAALPVQAVNNQNDHWLESTYQMQQVRKSIDLLQKSTNLMHCLWKLAYALGFFKVHTHFACTVFSPAYLCWPTLPTQHPQPSVPPQSISVQNHTSGRDHPAIRQWTITCESDSNGDSVRSQSIGCIASIETHISFHRR